MHLSRKFISLFLWSWLHTEPSAEKRKKVGSNFGFNFRYIDDILSLNNYKSADYVNQKNPIELEINDTTETEMSALYSWCDMQLMWYATKGYYL